MANGQNGDLAVHRRGSGDFLGAESKQPGGGNGIRPVDGQQGKRFELLDHPTKRRLRPKRLQNLLQYGSSEEEILAVSQELRELVGRRVEGGAVLAQGERPDRGIHEHPQPRRLRSDL